MSDVETCGNCGRSFRYMSFDRSSWAAFYCSEDCAHTKGVISVDQSTSRQYAEGVSPLTQVREYPMSEHTPGPWYSFIRPTTQTFAVFGPENNPRKPVVEWVGFDATITELGAKQVEANARLIAAAPDLLEALEAAEEYFDDRADAETLPDQGDVGNEEMRLMSICREALTKARGETHD